jgi:hypothetical protein
VDLLVQVPGVAQGRFPDGGTNLLNFPWSPSPGAGNYLPLEDMVISEVLTHTDPPLEDAIELQNLGYEAVDVSGWYLSDDWRKLEKYRLPVGSVIPARGYRVWYQYQFDPSPGGPESLLLRSAHGGEVILSASDGAGHLTGYRTFVQYGAALNGVAFGRYATSLGVDFVALSRRTFGVDTPGSVAEFRSGRGLANAYPSVDPLVINEIMYHPVSGFGTNLVEHADEEYLELANLTSSPVELYDRQHGTNRWKLAGGVEFEFPAGMAVPANGQLLVVGFDPVGQLATWRAFCLKYHLSTNVAVCGPYKGRLANEGESLSLWRPDAPQVAPAADAGYVPYVLVERVVYSSQMPWPAGADGTGQSLQRRMASEYGNEPRNWRAGRPLPTLAGSATGDFDGDGLPDDWELAFGLNPDSPEGEDGAEGDPDGDGLTNLEEFRAGTSPRAASVVITRVALEGPRLRLTFNGIARRVYLLQYRNTITGPWATLGTVQAPGTRELEVLAPVLPNTQARFYRLVMQ